MIVFSRNQFLPLNNEQYLYDRVGLIYKHISTMFDW